MMSRSNKVLVSFNRSEVLSALLEFRDIKVKRARTVLFIKRLEEALGDDLKQDDKNKK